MKVSEPRFDSSVPLGTVTCAECPFTDEDGFCEPDTPLYGLCNRWGYEHSPGCPDPNNYAEACALAEAAEKEGSK